MTLQLHSCRLIALFQIRYKGTDHTIFCAADICGAIYKRQPIDINNGVWFLIQQNHFYVCSGTGKRFSKRKEMCCIFLLNAGFEPESLEPNQSQQTERLLTNRLSYRGSSWNLNSMARSANIQPTRPHCRLASAPRSDDIHVCCWLFPSYGTRKRFSNRKQVRCLPLLNTRFEPGSLEPHLPQTQCPLTNIYGAICKQQQLDINNGVGVLIHQNYIYIRKLEIHFFQDWVLSNLTFSRQEYCFGDEYMLGMIYDYQNRIINSSSPGQNGHHFANGVFKCAFFKWNVLYFY